MKYIAPKDLKDLDEIKNNLLYINNKYSKSNLLLPTLIHAHQLKANELNLNFNCVEFINNL